MKFAALMAILLIWPLTIEAADLSGQATVIDGDTLEIHGQRIRLHGIDAPESGQTCKTGGGADYRCGQQAAFQLANFIGRGLVRCSQRDTDRYGRVVAVCYVGAANLGAVMVAQGWALAYRRYSMEYVSEEQEARTARRGVWQGEFVAPWDWRKGAR